MTKRLKITACLLAFLGVCSAIGFLLYQGILWFNNPDKAAYPVRGVDVSVYQGRVDWNTLANQDIAFAFIKATEGRSHQDARFAQNWQDAQQTPLAIGAYHFFSYDSDGHTQAANFIAAVPVLENALPPVIDIEFYGGNERNPPPKEKVLPILDALLSDLEQHYGKKPILYATMKSYRLYLAEAYQDYPLWIRNVLRTPRLPDGATWHFWQYSHRERLEGYDGEERFIDMNVWNGDLASFQKYVGSGEP